MQKLCQKFVRENIEPNKIRKTCSTLQFTVLYKPTPELLFLLLKLNNEDEESAFGNYFIPKKFFDKVHLFVYR